jgi:hypothetical protein
MNGAPSNPNMYSIPATPEPRPANRIPNLAQEAVSCEVRERRGSGLSWNLFFHTHTFQIGQNLVLSS